MTEERSSSVKANISRSVCEEILYFDIKYKKGIFLIKVYNVVYFGFLINMFQSYTELMFRQMSYFDQFHNINLQKIKKN